MGLMKAACTASIFLILSSSSAAFTVVPQSAAVQKVGRESSLSSWSRLPTKFSLMAVTVGDDTASVSSDNGIDRYQALGSWAQNTFSDAIVSPEVEFRKSSRSGGFGVFAANDIPKGSIVFSIPEKACVRVQDALDDEDCGKTFQALIDKAGPGGITVAMAGYLAKEYLRLQEPDAGTIKFAPYLETLPWERGINNQEHVLFWSDEDVETYLKGSISYDEALGLRSEVELAVRVLNGIIGPSVRAARGEQVASSKITWPWEKKAPMQDPSILVDGIDVAVRGAFVTLLTRSFAQGGAAQSEERLVPLLDMLQHSDEPSVTHQTRDDGTVEVRTRCDIIKGDEIFNQYQDEKARSMPYHRFFTRFGFVPGIAEPIRDLLAERSTIFFPQREAI
mmetsp:Transcript_12023/g.21849  ORF Transcript_12023/g.21849 Transcript_12023/m.21849 type:complete len:392 (-) Transcript_12023:1373-2548(-)